MAILKMKKLRICGVSEEQTQLIRQLQLLGSVEIGAPCALTDTQGVQVFCAGDGKSADALLRTSARLTSALETLKHYETKKGGLFAARPEKTIGELFSDEAYAAALDTAQAVLDAQDARSRLAAEKSRLTAVRESFVPWQQLPLPLETLGTQHTRILLGTVPAQTDLEALRARVFEAADEVQLEQISADQQSLYLLVFVHKCAAEAVGAALREAGFALTTFDGVQGTAAENIRRTDEAIAACEQQDAEKLAELTALAEQKSALQLAFDRCTQEIAKALEQYDFKVTVQALPWDQYLTALAEGRYDMYYGECKLTADWDATALVGTGGSLNYGGFSDPATDVLLAAYLSADDDGRAAAMERLCRRLQSEMPIIPLCFKRTSVLLPYDAVEHVTPTAADPFYRLENWTIHWGTEK